MHRGSDKHGPRQDDKLKHDVEGMVRGNRPSRVEEGRDPEPPADDDPEIGFERRLDTEETTEGDRSEPADGARPPRPEGE
ncbi:hypothetical protein [Streptoalloteichus hindustanus]|uniref:Uncharacterized protein n=1 Tax=Streptoalloteichus hindustanus TaxID=2017 RepID=A0A1M5AG82_STRHI|nr:hypothetical protein [Streptoalloteichus hindustanus]SHF29300.1 hypothetical protein SAMN05444320_103105 [Streptoalloteichus hindustanus]